VGCVCKRRERFVRMKLHEFRILASHAALTCPASPAQTEDAAFA
jgi:hypothetical protein